MLRSPHILSNNQLIDCDDDMDIPQQFDNSIPLSTNPTQKNHPSLIRNIHQNNHTKKSNSKSTNNKKLTLGLNSYQDIKSAYLRSNSKNADDKRLRSQQKQCTFTPKINQSKKTQQRNFNQFITEQESFLKNKNTKIEHIKTQLTERQEEKYTGTPKIDYRSRRISEENGSCNKNGNVFQRLSREKPKKLNVMGNSQQTFRPKILKKSKSLTRKGDISTLLYSDAQRREQKKQMMNTEMIKKSRIDSSSYSLNQNPNTNKLVGQKIKTQFQELIQGEQSGTLSPLVAITIISEIFNIDLNPNKEEQLCCKVIQFLVGEQEDTFSSDQMGAIAIAKLWDFISAIIGLNCNSQFYSTEAKSQIQQELGFFYGKRMTKNGQNLDNEPEQINYKVQISNNSHRLAEKHRNRQLSKLSQFIASSNYGDQKALQQNQNIRYLRLEDMFLLDSIRKRAELEEKKIMNQKEEMKQCSFRPSLTSKRNADSSEKKESLISTINRNDRNSLEKSKKPSVSYINVRGVPIVQEQQCSPFQEEEYEQQNKQSSKNMVSNCKKGKKIVLKGNKQNVCIRDMDKAILRMSIGRKMREYEHQQKERGYGSMKQDRVSSQNWLKKKQGEKKQLFLEHQNFKGYNLCQERKNN